MNKQTNRQLGYSLAEVLVALAIFAVIFLAALTAYDRSNRVFRQGVESSNMQQNTRVAFDKVVSDLRMAGYDFDRDGIPTTSVGGTNSYQQPDEQFEYIGPAAITVRSNLDYETENLPCAGAVTDNCDNGREKSLESTQFPVVTTGNDEIVTYALVPASNETGPFPACDPATNCVQLYADTSRPRKSFPDTGGVDEKLVDIPGVDLCNGGCNNPPYTLYRFTLDPNETDFSGGDHIIRTPLASNIRSMQLTYYQDAQGTAILKDLNNVTDESTGAAIRGLGQFKVAAPSALIAEREIRAKVNSVRLMLIGMNESRDAAYTDTAETLTAGTGHMNQYRKYRLETLISPRNIQKRGMREQDTFGPGAPTDLAVCTGACGGVYMRWTAPPVGVGYGAPDQYKVIYDVATSTGYNCETTTYTNTFGPVFGTTPACVLQGGVLYKFAVVALNSYGSNSSAPTTATPLNTTKMSPPAITAASTTLNGQVTLTWARPTTNASGSYTCPPDEPNRAELQGYIVEREDLATPGTWVQLPAGLPSGSVTTSSPTDTVTWTDTTAVNCVDYRFRVTAVEACAFHPTWNAGSDASIGHSDPSPEVDGHATTSIAPAAVPDLAVDPNSPCDGSSGTCNVNLAWQKVTKDTAGNPITIDTYIVARQLVGSGTWADVASVTGGALTYIDPNVPTSGGQTYLYRVRAHSKCPTGSGTDGAPSPERPYPCTFGAGILGTPLIIAPGAFDGDGSPANPFKVGSGSPAEADINVLAPGSIARVVGRDYTAGGGLLWQNTLTAPPFSFTWDLGTGATEQFNVAVVDTGGCVNQSFAWFEDEAQNCCLTPTTFDPTVVRFSVPTTFVDFALRTVCSQTLNLTGLSFTVDPTKTPSGEKLVKVAFPTSSGGCSDASFATNCVMYTFGSSGIGLTGSTPINVTVPGSGGAATFPSGVLPVPSDCTACVANIAVTSGGAGYAVTPSVTITGGGGTGATGTASISGGRVTGVTITKFGTGYTSTPTISFSGGGGSGAAATATIHPPYYIRVYFGSKSLTSAGNQPVTAMTVHYTDATSPGGTSCQIK